MRVRRTVPCFLVASLVVAMALGVLAAPGGVLAKGEPLFVVRPTGAHGELIAYDPADGTARVRLPAGMLSADGTRFWAATPDSGKTRLDAFDPTAGATLRLVTVDGAWDVAGVSATGRWVVLERQVPAAEREQWTKTGRWRTDLLVVDGDAGRVAHTIDLDGNFGVETISADGTALFLVEHLPAGQPGRYQVRLYDLPADALQEGTLRDKRYFEEVMTGLARDGVPTPDGRWLLTLYVNTQRNSAFVHALDLVNKSAVCLDLLSGTGDPADLAGYALTLAPDGRRAYATNPALGAVVELDLAALTATRTATFEPAPAAAEPPAPAGGAITPDGRTLFFTDGREVWTYDTTSGEVRRLHAFAAPVVGLGLNPTGDRLYAAGPDGPLGAIDTGSGALHAFPAGGAA